MRTWITVLRRWEKLILVGLVVLGCAGGELWWQHRGGEATGGGACLTTPESMAGAATPGALAEVDCGVEHEYEIIRTFKGDDGEQRCRQEADKFLGGPVDEARVVVALLHERVNANEGLRPCAVAEVSDTRGSIVGRVVGMQGTMTGDRRLAITCIGRVDDAGDADFRSCTAPHTGELVGVATDGGQPEASCGEAARRYIGDGFAARTDLGLRWLERGRTLCFAVDTTGEDLLQASLKGLGTAPLPH
jgi:hypothetical protein